MPLQWTARELWLLFVVLAAIALTAQGVHDSRCYIQRVSYQQRTGVRTVYYSQGYSTSCGWLGLRRCRRTRTRSRQETYTYSTPVYFQQSVCCTGYRTSSSGACEPICSNCQNGVCVHPEECVCTTGYIGPGCETPECIPPCDRGTCTSPGQCTCFPGYTGERCRLDIVECADGNNGGCHHNCANTIGSFTCSCREGYTLNSDERSCDDVNECLVNNGGCVDVCINTPGTFVCSCDNGYEFESLPDGTIPDPTNAGRACIDTDECAANNGGCEHICSNTIGSFECSCNNGYELERDGRGCTDVDECTTGRHNCTGLAQCVNDIGFFYCTCPDGYRLDDSQTSCIDPTDPIHQWDVTVNCSAADSVRVVYANYSSEDNMVLGDISFQEIRLHCTAPGGTAQAEVMPASVNCSGTSTGGNWRDDGFVFQNLGAAGIQSGWTCTIGGCFVLSRMVDGQDVWINTPSIEFVLRSGHCDLGVGPSSTVEPVTTLPTTAETMTLHTTVNTATTGKGVNAGTGNAVTHNDSDATTTSTQSVTTVAKMEPDTTGTKLLIIGSCTAIILLALMMLTTITVLMLVIYWKVWKVPATSVFVVEKNNAQSNEVCQVELGSESIKVSAINMDEKYTV